MEVSRDEARDVPRVAYRVYSRRGDGPTVTAGQLGGKPAAAVVRAEVGGASGGGGVGGLVVVGGLMLIENGVLDADKKSALLCMEKRANQERGGVYLRRGVAGGRVRPIQVHVFVNSGMADDPTCQRVLFSIRWKT